MAYRPLNPTSVSRLSSALVRFLLKVLGWDIEDGYCDVHKAVITAAPHTTNWDLFYTLLSAAALRVPIWFMMKHTHFWWPMTILWRFLGGVPVNRTISTSVVSQMVKAFHECDTMFLVIPPEGTRKKVDCWKTGFYYTALKAGIPIWPWFINYKTKRTGGGPLIYPTGDIESDFDRIRTFYEEHMGPMPEIRPAAKKEKHHDESVRKDDHRN